MKKEELLRKAYEELNKRDYPFEVAIDNDTIIATWKWKDGTFFDVGSVTREIQTFKYSVKVLDDFTYIDNDSSFSSTGEVDILNQNVGQSFEAFSGQQYKKHIEFTFGKDKDTGKVNIQKYSFDLDKIHKPIKEFLENNGYSKANQNLFQIQKTSINSLDSRLVKILVYMFTFIGGTMTLVNIFLIFKDSFWLIFLFVSLIIFFLGIVLLVNVKKRK